MTLDLGTRSGTFEKKQYLLIYGGGWVQRMFSFTDSFPKYLQYLGPDQTGAGSPQLCLGLSHG